MIMSMSLTKSYDDHLLYVAYSVKSDSREENLRDTSGLKAELFKVDGIWQNGRSSPPDTYTTQDSS